MDKPVAAPAVGAKEKIDKQARQLAYDTRYKVKQSMKAKAGGRIDPAAMRKAFVSQLAKSPAAPAIKARAKQMLMGEGYIDVKDLVKGHTANALFKVFVEHHKKDADGNTIPQEDEEITEAKDEKTFKVRVTDKKTGNSYVRMASRSKIADLRSNPNISSVEMTEYGEVTKSEKAKGSKTASVKAGKGVDYDGDGKVESGSKEHAGVVHNAIQKKKGGTPDGKDTRKETYSWKEAFSGLIEKKSEEDEKKITGKGVNNAKLIKVFPDEVKEGYDKKKDSDCVSKSEKGEHNCAKKVCHEKYGIGNCIPEQHTILEDGTVSHYDVEFEEYIVENCPVEDLEILVTEMHSHSAKKKVSEDYDTAVKTKNEQDPNGKAKKEEDEDGRSMYTKWNLVKNRLRAMGLKMSHEPEGETIEEAERTLASRMDRKSKLYDKTVKKAMKFARDEGEASGHARFNMSRLGREKDKLAAKRREANEAYDNTKSPDYDKKKKALAKKHGGADKVKGHPQYESTVQTALDSLDSIPAKKN